jgi:uncharacterized membrane protein
MKNNKIIKSKILASLAVLMFLGISFVSAFSVSSPYMENKTLNLYPDSKTTDLQFVLQNGGGATDNVSIKVEVISGSDILSLVDNSNIYTVVPGNKVPVNMRITLPSNATVGDNYNIALEFTTVASGESGQFGFGTGQEQDFKVSVVNRIVTEGETKHNGTLLYIILGILVLLVIIVLVLIKRKNRK